MNQIIQRLSEVETAAASILEEASARKKQMAKEQADKIADFEKKVHKETEEKINEQRSQIEKMIKQELETQKKELEEQLEHMDRIYKENHSTIAKQLLAKIAAQ